MFLSSLQKSNIQMFSSIQEEYKPEIEGILAGYEFKQKRKQALIGVIVSTKCAKSVTVKVFHKRIKPKYLKEVEVPRKIMAHDEEGLGRMGDVVRIVPCRPMSSKKRHVLMDIVKRPESVTTSNGTVFTTAGRLGRK